VTSGVTWNHGYIRIPQHGTPGLADGRLFCTEPGTIVAVGVFAPASTSTAVNGSQ
jgi:hypothetical protein